jgi:hypothetical protein
VEIDHHAAPEDQEQHAKEVNEETLRFHDRNQGWEALTAAAGFG